MRIWIDAQLSPAIGAWINRTYENITAESIQSVDLRDALDHEIFEQARRQDVVVMRKTVISSNLLNSMGQLPREVTEVELDQGEGSVSDGSFIEGKELIPGFTVIRVDSKQEGIEWAKELRECMGNGIIKIARLSATSKEDTKM